MELKFDSRTDVIPAFATPVYTFRVDGSEPLNAALAESILRREREGPPAPGEPLGAWQAGEDFFAWDDRGVDTVRQCVTGAIQTVVPLMLRSSCTFQTRLAARATVLRYGGAAKRRSHPGSQITLVYHVATGTPPSEEAPESGVLELFDPRAHAEMAALPGDSVGRSLMIRPEAGQLIVFPSWMYHQVNPYLGEGERISVTITAQVWDVVRTPAG